MDFYDVIRTRRSIRRYKSKDIPNDVLFRILESARIAPSGNNRQPWRFVVVRDEEKKKKIAQACYDQSFIAQAPLVIVCCSIKCTSGYQPWLEQAGPRDVVIATDHLILAARNEGIGSCWIGALYPEKVAKIINLPDELDVVMVVPLGYPTSESAFSEPTGRKSLNEIFFADSYGEPISL